MASVFPPLGSLSLSEPEESKQLLKSTELFSNSLVISLGLNLAPLTTRATFNCRGNLSSDTGLPDVCSTEHVDDVTS